MPVIGGKENNSMKKRIRYTNEKIGPVRVVKDFLPKPEELVRKDETVKVTLNLSRTSVEFFKSIAVQHGSQYQKVIRSLLDAYAAHHS